MLGTALKVYPPDLTRPWSPSFCPPASIVSSSTCLVLYIMETFLANMEVHAQVVQFLARHLKDYGNAGRGKQSYISSTIVEELIELMAKNVRAVTRVRAEGLNIPSVSVDSTPDLSHVDQLTVIVRYLLHGKAVERFKRSCR